MSAEVAAARPLVGRARELAALESCLQRLPQGHGTLALVEGEAGIGKSSLVLAFGERARTAGADFGVGRCYELGAAPPFAPWHDLLTDLRASAGLDSSALPPPFGSGQPAQTAYQLLRAVDVLLRAASAARPLVLLLDDLHWADRDTLELMDLATRRLDDAALLVIATYRPEDLLRRHPLYDFLPQLRRDRPVEAIRLGEFGVAETALLVESRHGPCSPELAAYLHARSGGSPFFVSELLRDLVERGLLAQDGQGRLLPPIRDVQVSAMLRQVILRRIARLGEEAQALLDVAAIAGEEWELAVVEAVLGWEEEPVLRGLQVALEARVVVPVGSHAEAYRFAHGLIREVLYQEQLARRRKHLHARVAAALEPTGGSGPGLGISSAALAYHFGMAEDWEKAFQYGVAAGDAARERYASHSALRFYEQALAAATRASGEPAHDRLLAVYERLGEACLILNQHERAGAEFAAMLDAARARGDLPAEGRALFWLSFMLTRQYHVAESREAAEAALRVAEQAGDARLLATTHWNLGHVYKTAGDLDPAARHLQEAERVARAANARDVLGWALQHRSQLAIWGGSYRRAELLASEALALARATHDALALGGACWALGFARGELGRYEAAREALQAGLDHAEESGERHYQVRLLNTMGWVYGELEDTGTALRWDRMALEACRAGHTDRVTEAERYSLLNLAKDAVQAGELEMARAHLAELEPMLHHSEYSRFRYLNRYELLRSELALASGDPEAALRWAEQAADLAASKGMRKNLVRTWLLKGRALLALGRAADATAPLQRAVTLADELGHGSLRWHTRLRLGQANAALRRPAAAADVYRQALDQVGAIAAELTDGRLRDSFLASALVGELRAAVAATGPQARPVYPAGLSSREVQVLRLVARGDTNAAIGGALSISVKTVNAHLSSILAKTECANRAAAAAFAQRHGLG